jgi:hypothetical protein
MTTPTTSDLLKYADLQMAAEAFLVDPSSGSDTVFQVKPRHRNSRVKRHP